MRLITQLHIQLSIINKTLNELYKIDKVPMDKIQNFKTQKEKIIKLLKG